MIEGKRHFDDIGLHVPTLLLPRPDIDLTKWAVIACDQYTSQPEYWEQVAEIVGTSPSTFHLVLPEVYLETPHGERLIHKINRTMQEYLAQGILVEYGPGFVLIDRITSHGISRKGLLVALDLEQYDYARDAQTIIRATEGTVLERLPPRIHVRKKACLEIPHIMVLIDDPEHTVIEPLFRHAFPKLYDAPLMLGGGHVKGYGVTDPVIIEEIATALRALAGTRQHPLLYAIGDGNHSLAAAKMLWETIKKTVPDPELVSEHPARYALVELVNIHDGGLAFEPIHRILFNVGFQATAKAMRDFYRRQGSGFSMAACDGFDALKQRIREERHENRHCFGCISEHAYSIITVTNPPYNLEAETLQVFLDTFIARHYDVKIDYIHGDDTLEKIGVQPGNIGFYLPPIDKHSFFTTIMLDGALPRKTFSMGDANDKRFYLECRKIIP
ncbi:MAG: DUF1015 domain-containing protein [Desulfobacterota bacterium]|nr:DUF1015 domain-containing protein [Thermodesulfobacteriota bacterium]